MRVSLKIKDIINKIKSSNIGLRMASGAFWSFTGTAIAKFIVLIGGILCARILGKEEYGEFGMVRSTITMFVALGTAGLGMTATKYISEFRNRDIDKVGNIYKLTNGFAIITGTVITIIVLLLSKHLAINTLNAPHLISGIRIGALLLFVTILNGAQNGTLAGFENFRAIAINTFFGSVMECVLMLLGAYYWGVNGAILGFGCGYATLFVLNNISIKKLLKAYSIVTPKFRLNHENLRVLAKFSLPAALSSLMVSPIYWVVRSILVNKSGFGELAVYEAAEQWRIIILFIPGAISHIVLPILSSIRGDDINKFWKVLKLNLLLNAGVAAFLSLLIIPSSSFIMSFYGKGYDNVWPIIILSLSTILSSMASVVGLSISSRSKMWVGFGFNAFWGCMMVTFTYLFTTKGFGATGLALSILCSYAIHTTLQLLYLRVIAKSENVLL